MEAKLKEILKKAKVIDAKARQFDTVDKTKLQSKIDERAQSVGLYEAANSTPTPQPTQPKNLIQPGSVDNNQIRKMIAEEIAKALPSIVEKYFDKKMIKENVNIWKSLRVKSKKS